jgi:hypothetical protein
VVRTKSLTTERIPSKSSLSTRSLLSLVLHARCGSRTVRA